MAGEMSVEQVQKLISTLQQQMNGAAAPADLERLQGEVQRARTQLEGEVGRDSAELQKLVGRQQTRSQAELVEKEVQEGTRGLRALQSMQDQLRGRLIVARNPELERSVAGPLREAQTRMQRLQVPDAAIATLLGTVQANQATPEQAAATYMTMLAAVTREDAVPEGARVEIAAALATTQLQSKMAADKVIDAFRIYLQQPNTTPGNAEALVGVYANRLAAAAEARGVELGALPDSEVRDLRSAVKSDYDHFVEKTEGDGAISVLLAGAITPSADRAKVWEQYQFFDGQDRIDSMQAAILTAGLMARATDVATLPQMRTNVLDNYRAIINMRPPETMPGASISPYTAAGYAAAGLGPQTVHHHHHDSGLSTFTQLMMISWFMSSHPTYGTGYYSGHSAGYSSGYWAGREAANRAATAPTGSAAPAAGRPVTSAPAAPRINPVARMGNTAAMAERAATGKGVIGTERRQLGAGMGRNTTVLGTDGRKMTSPTPVTRTGGGLGRAATPSGTPDGGRRLGGGMGRDSNVSAPTRSSSPSPSGGRVSGGSVGGTS